MCSSADESGGQGLNSNRKFTRWKDSFLFQAEKSAFPPEKPIFQIKRYIFSDPTLIFRFGLRCDNNGILIICVPVYCTHRVGRVVSFFPVVGIGTSPTPHPRQVCPPPFGSGGRGTLAGERGVGGVPIPARGHTLWYSVNICTLWLYTTVWWCVYNKAATRPLNGKIQMLLFCTFLQLSSGKAYVISFTLKD